MCRHLAYLGPTVSLQALITDPPYGLSKQAWAPRCQSHGTMNVDGFGVGWYADGDPVPARYRRAGPIWADPCFADLAGFSVTTAPWMGGPWQRRHSPRPCLPWTCSPWRHGVIPR
jgi:glutamine amidotransferase